MLFGCTNCCSCTKCTDGAPKRLIVSLDYPPGSGETLLADDANPPAYGAVTTNCEPVGSEFPIISVTLDNAGDGYTTAPTLTPTPSGAVLVTELRRALESVEVTAGGSGYTTTPTVSITGGTKATQATAVAVIKGGGTAATVTAAGADYTSPPTVSAEGGTGLQATAVMSGYVYEITLAQQGDGYTSTPTVTITGNATATATVADGKVTGITVTAAGSGYTSAPTVTVSGGGGSGAAATAVLRYRVSSVTVQSGGSGYGLQAPLIFTGGGGSGAAGTLQVSGSVDEVIVTDGGDYFNRRRTDGTNTQDWPTVTFSGGGGSGAQATAYFGAGPINAVSVWSGGAYEEPPTLAFSGGGGSGAEATAYIAYQSTNEIGIDIGKADCTARIETAFCTGTDSEAYPIAPCLGCGGRLYYGGATDPPTDARYGEAILTIVTPLTSGAAGSPSGRSDVVAGQFRNLNDFDYTPGGEYIYVYVGQVWGVSGVDVYDERLYVKRFFSRVPPTGGWIVRDQPESAVNAVLSPVLKQSEDLAGQPFWWIESFSVVSGGENMVAGAGGNELLSPDDDVNYPYPYESLSAVNAVYTYSTPVVNAFGNATLFSSPPQFAYTFSPVGNGKDYTLTGISISSAGSGGPSDGQYYTTLSFSTGYPSPSPTISFTVSGGSVQSVSIDSAGTVRGGASLQSVELPEQAEFAYPPRILIGRSTLQATTTYSEPTVTASAPPGSATFSVTLDEGVDANGNPYWFVTAVTIVDGGSGYLEPVGLDFSVAGPNGIEAIPAVVVASPPGREEPTLSIGGSGDFTIAYTYESSCDCWVISDVTVVDGGSGYTNGQSATIILGEEDNEITAADLVINTVLEEPTVTATVSGGSGAQLTVTLEYIAYLNVWSILSISIVSAGTGYADGAEIVFSGGDQDDSYAYATITADQDGVITGVQLGNAGAFYDDTGQASSVTVNAAGAYYKQRTELETISIVSGGRYFNRVITVTETPLPDVECDGEVSEEAGWELLRYKPAAKEYEVGDEYDVEVQAGCWTNFSTYYDFTRVRRCGFPTVTLRFEK
jgi:hypothetical protein